MRNFIGWVRYFILSVLLGTVGCTYETVEEAEQEKTTVDAPDSGAGDSINMSVSGSAKSASLTRGVSNFPQALGNSVGEDSAVWTVQFSIVPNYTPPPVPNVNPPTICYAIIKWSIAGNDIQRIVSVGNGVSLAGVGEGATIQVYDATNFAGLGFVNNTDNLSYTVTATVSPGTRGNAENPPLFIPSVLDKLTGKASSGTLTAGTGVDIPIPVGAGATSVQVISGNIAVLTGTALPSTDYGLGVQQNNPAVGTLRDSNTIQYPGQFIPLDLAATVIHIANPANSNAATQVYGIVFGIDG